MKRIPEWLLLTSAALAFLALLLVLIFSGSARGASGVEHGFLVKPQLQPRAIASIASTCWKTPATLVRAVAVEQAEAVGYVNAYNDNHAQLGDPSVRVAQIVLNAETLQPFTVVSKSATAVVLRDGNGVSQSYPLEALVVVSRDVGLFQINIPASQIGTQTERDLYVPANNVAAACALWTARGFQPWSAYNSGVYLHDSYIQRALLGVANLLSAGLVADAKTLGQTPLTRTPFISIPDLRLLYPTVAH